jgi:hypothetical protein
MPACGRCRNPGGPAVCRPGVGAFGSGGSVARVWSRRSKSSGAEEDAATSRWDGSNPNIPTENLQGVEGSSPISKRPASSVTVEILLPAQSAETVAPGIAWLPECTDPVCVSAAAIPTKMKIRPVTRSMHEDSELRPVRMFRPCGSSENSVPIHLTMDWPKVPGIIFPAWLTDPFLQETESCH